jgi:hypothetical protein
LIETMLDRMRAIARFGVDSDDRVPARARGSVVRRLLSSTPHCVGVSADVADNPRTRLEHHLAGR